MLVVFFYSFFQGFTEFLPISSQGHLILFNLYFNINEAANISILEANILVHLGSLFAVVIYYYRINLNLLLSIKHIPRPDIDQNSTLLINLIVATIPGLICGYFFAKFFNYNNDLLILIMGITSIFFGIILFIFDKFCLMVKSINEITIKNSLVIGIFQSFALIPGVSRSGAVLTSLRLMGFNRNFSVFFSNLLSIPVILGAVIFLLIQNDNILSFNSFNYYKIYLIFFSFISSLIFIHFFVSWVRKASLAIFMIYRIIFGIYLIYFFFNI